MARPETPVIGFPVRWAARVTKRSTRSGMSARRSPQRRQAHPHHGQAVEQVLAEPALGHQPPQVAVGRGDDPHVGGDRRRRPERLVLVILHHPEELHLHRGRHVADLVQEERAGLGRGDAARLVPPGVGERALHVAEQLRLQQRLGQGGAAHLDEPALPARAQVVDGARDEPLARAARALDEDRGVALRHRRQDVQHLGQAGVLADDVPQRVARVDLALELLDQRQVAERLDPAGALPAGVAEDGGADADRHPLPVAPQDVDAHVDQRPAGLHGAPERAVGLADVGAEHLVAVLADGLRARELGDLLGRAVEARDAPVAVHGEDAVGDAVEDRALDLRRRRGHGTRRWRDVVHARHALRCRDCQRNMLRARNVARTESETLQSIGSAQRRFCK
jgi:hypothetical protein